MRLRLNSLSGHHPIDHALAEPGHPNRRQQVGGKSTFARSPGTLPAGIGQCGPTPSVRTLRQGHPLSGCFWGGVLLTERARFPEQSGEVSRHGSRLLGAPWRTRTAEDTTDATNSVPASVPLAEGGFHRTPFCGLEMRQRGPSTRRLLRRWRTAPASCAPRASSQANRPRDGAPTSLHPGHVRRHLAHSARHVAHRSSGGAVHPGAAWPSIHREWRMSRRTMARWRGTKAPAAQADEPAWRGLAHGTSGARDHLLPTIRHESAPRQSPPPSPKPPSPPPPASAAGGRHVR